MSAVSIRQQRAAAIVTGTVAALVCMAVVYATPRDSYWIVDSGSKALMAQRLLETRYTDWGWEHPASAYDPTGAAFPATPPFAVRHGSGFISAHPPAYAAIAAPWLSLFGPPGLRVPAALGAGLLAALFAGWLTPVLGARAASGWALVLALATPVFFYGVTVWEHTLAAALALGACRWAGHPARRSWLGAGCLIAAGCWLREELALMGLALALACGLHYRRWNPVVWLIAGAAPLLIALVAFNAAFYGDPLGVHLRANLNPADAMARPLTEMARRIVAVLVGQGASPGETALLGAAVALAWPLGWLGARRAGPLRHAAWVALALGLAAWAWPLVGALGGAAPLQQLVDYNGLLVRVPLAAGAGIGLWNLRAPRYASLRLGVGSGLGFIALTLAAGVFTHSQLGAGVHWGPRTLLPALPALVALFIVALRGDPDAQPRYALRWAGAALVTAGLFSSGQSAWLLYHQKADAERLQTAILSAPPQIIVTSHPLLALHLAPIWPYKPMLRLLDKPSLDRLARRLRLDGIGDLLLLTPPGSPEVSTRGGLRCQIVARPRGRLHYLDMDLQTCRLIGN